MVVFCYRLEVELQLNPKNKEVGSKTHKFLKGVDICHWDGQVNWSKVNQNFTFAFIKATEGMSYIDPNFKENWIAAQKTDLLCGAYHFYSPGDSPLDQAYHFIDTVGKNFDLPLVLEIEDKNGITSHIQLVKDIQEFLDIITEKTLKKPIIYTSAIFWNAYLTELSNAGDYPLWVASYTDKPSPQLPISWDNWVFWQFTEKGDGPALGVENETLDINYFSGDLKSLLQLCKSSEGQIG
jgi:lysozyme